jgi:hypothetical protein
MEKGKSMIDDSEMFKLFALFDKFNRNPESLTASEKHKMYGVSIR